MNTPRAPSKATIVKSWPEYKLIRRSLIDSELFSFAAVSSTILRRRNPAIYGIIRFVVLIRVDRDFYNPVTQSNWKYESRKIFLTFFTALNRMRGILSLLGFVELYLLADITQS